MRDQIIRIEALQGLRATLESMARDLRLGGACLPTDGNFVSLSGTDSATADTIVTRTGLVRQNRSCIRTALRRRLQQTSRALKVDSISGFAIGMRAMIWHPNGTGELFTITGINTSRRKLLTGATFAQTYPKTSGVYAIDERAYSIDTSSAPSPVLTIAANGDAPMPFAAGIENLNVRYELARNCPPCDIVDAPAPGSDDWRLVNQILITATVRSLKPLRNGQYFRRTGRISAKPRNLLPG